jgi:hypothetical protein
MAESAVQENGVAKDLKKSFLPVSTKSTTGIPRPVLAAKNS